MSTNESRNFIQQYLNAINGVAKPPALVNQYVAAGDEALRQHIADAEVAFPRYSFSEKGSWHDLKSGRRVAPRIFF